MCVEVVKLIWKNIGVGDEVEVLPPKFLLHLHIVVAKTIFPSDFVTLWEVVDSLELI